MCARRTVIVERVARCEGPAVRFVAKRARGEVGGATHFHASVDRAGRRTLLIEKAAEIRLKTAFFACASRILALVVATRKHELVSARHEVVSARHGLASARLEVATTLHLVASRGGKCASAELKDGS